ncbi:WASH complex subunit 2 isoform X3 [Aricia agestis]|uniref:WASH complex subunit 2 isoform X3 n=1 Tax=Aricia agestis TaxID=91739 RepID=UPI001C20BCD7|nr:WASH complex subunit 2 isoform X3 [Aricia agestis]
MIMESRTAELRKSAPEWSLAGDRNLLQALQDLHQKLMSKCQEVNTNLDDMVNKLDNASVDLQNVNNKFLALSNSQFIESRVYDEDITLEGEQEMKTNPPVSEEDELLKLKRSLQTFERMHEAVRILDSDSSDEDDDFSTILKPKDMYSQRPLPYIIGSRKWETKWHVGLVPSESESDDGEDNYFAKRQEPREQYSESESEDEGTYQKEATRVSSSSEAEWEPSPGTSARPADVAAQIARRLAAQEPALETEIESRQPSIPDSGPRKVYRAEQPGTIPVFSEEPPPLDDSIDDYSDNYSDEEDIFAELHRKPSTHRQSDPRSVDPIVEKLFGDEILRNEDKQDEKVASSVGTSILLKNDSKANLLPQKNVAESTETNRKEQTIKKPVGGMSLFGSSQGAESIGAAILKRNQRKSSTSDDEDKPVEDNSQPQRIVNSVPPPANKIIEDLFTKPQATKKLPTIGKVTGVTSTQKSTPKPKMDLFSDDNIFDDLDDTFTSGIVTKPKETKQKSIFDDDDLFVDVITNTVAKDDKKKSLFDSDDELFKEDSIETTSTSAKKTVTTKINETSGNKNTEASIFSDGNDSDDIFTSNNNTPNFFQSRTMSETSDQKSAQNDNSNTVHSTNHVQTIHNEITVQHTQTSNKTLEPTLPKKFESPLLFDEDDIDDLFTSNMNASKIRESKIGSNKDEHVFDNESVIKATKASKENNDQASEKQALKDTGLVVNNTESDKYLFNSPKSREEVGYDKNTNDSILKISNDSDKNRNKVKNFVSEDFKVEETKNISLENEESLGDIKGTEKVTVTSDYLLNAPVNKENANNLSDSVTTESISTTIKHNQKQHDEFEDLFSDIPPAFEKPAEPKKSKNVNALFDDDSDDEALFFRKSDVTDEKPKVSYDNDRFRIFHDEPPDVDVDFTTKTENALKTVDSDEDLFTLPKYNENGKNKPDTIDKYPSNVKTGHENIQQNDDLYSKTQDSVEIKKEESLDISKLLSSEIIETDSKLNSEISSTVNQPIPNIVSEQNDKDTEISGKKSVGKLKPMNININVQSLLPGASPTKQKPKDESDGSTFSTQSNEELNKYSNEKEDLKMVKSVSFDGDPGSEVLDNKLSKGRARIQVKRRPSSRRARLEAVRKSGIDFTDDSTDNSSSFDEPKPASSYHDRSSEVKEVPVHTSTSDIVSTTTVNTVISKEMTSSKNIDNLENNITTEVKSKTVYILHDEDIFSNSPNTKTDTTKKSLTILDDDDDEDLFKSPGSTSAKTNKTLEKPKEDINKNISKNNKILVPKATKSIFDDLSDDDELFGGKNASESRSNVKSKDTNKVKHNVSSMKTGSLFGDDSDDEDLFKTARNNEVKAAKPKEITTVKSTAVTHDPLSLFDDD